MARLIDSIDGRRVDRQRPWPRIVTTEQGWSLASQRVSAGDWTMLGLWGERGAVHMAIFVGAGLKPAPTSAANEIAVLTIECPDGRLPSVGALHPPAIRLERALRDLYG